MSASSTLSPRARVAGLALAGVTALGGGLAALALVTGSATAQTAPAPAPSSGSSSPSAPSYDDRDCPERSGGTGSTEQAPADAQGEA